MKELLLKIDGMRGDDCFFIEAAGIEDGGNEIREAFPDTGTGLNNQGMFVFQRFGDGDRHLLLRLPIFKFFRF